MVRSERRHRDERLRVGERPRSQRVERDVHAAQPLVGVGDARLEGVERLPLASGRVNVVRAGRVRARRLPVQGLGLLVLVPVGGGLREPVERVCHLPSDQPRARRRQRESGLGRPEGGERLAQRVGLGRGELAGRDRRHRFRHRRIRAGTALGRGQVRPVHLLLDRTQLRDPSRRLSPHPQQALVLRRARRAPLGAARQLDQQHVERIEDQSRLRLQAARKLGFELSLLQRHQSEQQPVGGQVIAARVVLLHPLLEPRPGRCADHVIPRVSGAIWQQTTRVPPPPISRLARARSGTRPGASRPGPGPSGRRRCSARSRVRSSARSR